MGSKASNMRSRLKARVELRENPDDPRHGTTNGYGVGCRCDRCRVAMKRYSGRYFKENEELIKEKRRLYYRNNKANVRKSQVKRYEEYVYQMQQDPNDPRHGTRTGYTYGCRCDKCKAASHEYSHRRYMESKKEKNDERTGELEA